MKDGKGVFVKKNEYIYTGEWKNDMKDGQGEFRTYLDQSTVV